MCTSVHGEVLCVLITSSVSFNSIHSLAITIIIFIMTIMLFIGQVH